MKITTQKNFRLDPTLAARLAAAAQEQGCTETALLSRALERELEGMGEELAKALEELLEVSTAPPFLREDWEVHALYAVRVEEAEEQARAALGAWRGEEQEKWI